MTAPMPERDPLLTGLSCAMALGCFVSISLLNVAFVAALITLLVRVERSGWKPQRLPGIDLPILLYALAFILSALMGVDAESSFGYITELKRPVIAYVIASSLTTRADTWKVAGAAAAGASISTLLAFQQWICGGTFKLHNVIHTYEPWALGQPMGLAATHNDLATLLAQLLGVALVPLVFYFSKLDWRQRALAAATTVLFAAGILRTLSRASLLASLGGLVAVGLVLRPRRLLAVILLLALIYPALPPTLKQRHQGWFDLKSNYSNWFRYRMMEISAQIAKDHLPWGIGRHNFPKVHETLKAPAEEISPHAHNNYLQILVEMGIPGIVTFVWLQVAVIGYLARRASSRAYDYPERMLLGAVLMGFVSFVVNGFFHYDWGDALPSSFMWVLVGLACAVGERLALTPSPKPLTDEPLSAASTVLA